MSDINRNARQLLQKRYGQVDGHLLKCIEYLAQMRATLSPRDRMYALDLFKLLCQVEKTRIGLLGAYRMFCGGPETGMRSPEQLIEILESAQPIPKTVR